MIALTAFDAKTYFSGKEKELKKHLFPLLRVEDKNAFWRARATLKRAAYFRDYGESERAEKIAEVKEAAKWVRFYERRGDSFLTGLLPMVMEKLDKKGAKYKLEDRRKRIPKFKPLKKFDFRDKIEHREEQIAAANAALSKGRGILHCATNFGKSEVACAIIAEFVKQTKHTPTVLFLIHRISLVQQTYERFLKHLPESIKVYKIGGGKKKIPTEGVLVATVQTASHLLHTVEFSRFQEKCDILFVDEHHVNKARQCSYIVEKNSAPMRFGLSGTISKDKIKLMHYMGMCGPIIAEVRNKDLVELGRSAKPIARFLEVDSPAIPKKVGFAKSYSLGVVNNEIRNRMVVEEVLRHLKKNRKTLVTVARIRHGVSLLQELEKRIDLRVEFLSGSTPVFKRQKVIREFEKGKVSVVIASQIFDVGIDIPAIQACVFAGGGKGFEITLQRLGRTLRRKKEGRNVVHITDFVDLCSRYLFRHSLRRIQLIEREGIAKISIVETS